MKQRYFTFLGSAWLLLFASAATIPPYYSELGDKLVKDIASDWIVINANKTTLHGNMIPRMTISARSPVRPAVSNTDMILRMQLMTGWCPRQ